MANAVDGATRNCLGALSFGAGPHPGDLGRPQVGEPWVHSLRTAYFRSATSAWPRVSEVTAAMRVHQEAFADCLPPRRRPSRSPRSFPRNKSENF